MTKEELEEQLKVISEKCKQTFTELKDLGDGSVYLVSQNGRIRISKHDLEIAVEQLKYKL